ncbi:MAG: sigma-70 family RNA polymerase sigma factor, partial [Xanthobacteraceae bacterium]|nr:sigma-70 family RNA polymerase sigma factor [Xanthobacteraceae bacterium]
VRNTAYTWLMKNRPRSVVFTEDLPVAERQNLERVSPDGGSAETPEEIALSRATSESVQRAILALPPPFREVIVLREMHELNYRDIADVTNLPIGTVMSRLSRARQLLVEMLEGHDP